jgi:putative acetyltransferase
MSEVIIRTFVEKDQAAVAALYKAGENAYEGIPVVGDCYHWFVNDKLTEDGDVANIQKHFMADPQKGCFWVAEYDEEVVGFVGAIPCTRYDASYVELIRMFVSPEIRKKAVGVKLVNTLESWARDVGYKNIYLSTLAGFPGANVLYPKCGFTLVEAEDFDVTERLQATAPVTVCVNHYTKSIC